MNSKNERTAPSTMKAIVINKITPASAAKLSVIEVPRVKPSWLLVRVRGRGLNHSEQVLRLGEVGRDYIAAPIVPGIECVGEVADPGDTPFAEGQRVCAFMGGMGRSFHGSYAEYVLAPAHHTFALPPSTRNMPWAQLAAIPETFFTAWGSLFECMSLGEKDTLLVRGGSCALGYAAVQIAHALGCKVAATVSSARHRGLLERLGCAYVLEDDGALAAKGLEPTKVLELVGTKTLLDSLKTAGHGGVVCHTGILGGEEPLHAFSPLADIPNGVHLTGFHSNWPNQKTVDDMFKFIARHGIEPVIAATFPFERIGEALSLQDRGGFEGKIVVTE